MIAATDLDIEMIYHNIDLYKKYRVSSIYSISRLLENKLFPQNILQTLLDLDRLDSHYFIYPICVYQNLSKEFIAKNLQRLYYTDKLLDNPNIPEDTKTYIRMFI